MYYEVYLDSLFVMVFSMNLCLLSLTGRITGCTATHWGILKGAAFGAGMECLLLLLPGIPAQAKTAVGYLAVSTGMVKLTFPGGGKEKLLERTLCLYIAAFSLGGILDFLVTAVPFLRERKGSLILLIFAAVSFTFAASWLFGRLRRKKNLFCTVILGDGTKEVAVRALLDSGNSLADPVTGKPVCIVEKEQVESLAICMPQRLRVIPYHTIGKSHGMLLGYEVPMLKIQSEEQEKTVMRAVVGLYERKLSAGGHYQMIVNPALLED